MHPARSGHERVLLNNIYGVDVDRQAVEVTKLSLLLKVTEGETEQISQRDWIREHERILPDLAHNIRCGNSIVATDFYDAEQASLLPELTKYRINAFDWETGFRQIVVQEGGFDCIIGNPPYVDIKGMPDEVASYIFERYDCANNRINLFATFIEKSLKLLKPTDGYFSMIVPTAIPSPQVGAIEGIWPYNEYAPRDAPLPARKAGAVKRC
jgi:hypothetical protein